ATNSDGQYQISTDQIRSSLPKINALAPDGSYAKLTFASAHHMNVNDRFVVSGALPQSLNGTYVVHDLLSGSSTTLHATLLASGVSMQTGTTANASLLYAPIPSSGSFSLHLINPFLGPDGEPTDFVFGSDNGILSGVTSGNQNANFSVKEKAVIRGNVFNDA